MKYLYWRGRSLWSRFPLPGYPPRYPLSIIRMSDSKTEIARCEHLAELRLSELRTDAVTGDLQKKRVVDYNPKFWRLVARYWYHHLRFVKGAEIEKYPLKQVLSKFGARYAKDIDREDIELWRQSLKLTLAVNTINIRFTYLRCVFSWAQKESRDSRKFMYDPTVGLKRLSGGNVRTFVLTQEQFEKNYSLFVNGLKWAERPSERHCHYRHQPDPLFAKFYLALWETMRRPEELSQYTWEMHSKMILPDDLGVMREINVFLVPPALAKTDEYDTVIISDRLWKEISGTLKRKGLVFVNRNGNRWQYWNGQKERLADVFGEKGGWIRDNRRGAITHAVEVERHDPSHVQMQSGHKTDAMFKRYRIGKLQHVMGVVNKTEYKGDVSISNA